MGLTSSLPGCIIALSMSAIQETPRESGSPIPAQRADRLPYETPPLQILVDPSDSNIDLGTQLGFGENTLFSSRLKPGRLMPTDLGISHHVLDYRMDQMAQEPERLAEQPTPPSLLQRAGETLRRVAPPALVPATALGAGGAAVITIVQPNVPSAEASGNRMLYTASADGTAECVKDDPNTKPPFVLYTVDPEYARKLVAGLASGEIVVAGRSVVAAVSEGDKTAVIQPITITPEEAWQNLIIPAPDCEGLTAREALDVILNQKDSDIDKRESQDVRDLNNALWDEFEAELLTFKIPDDPTVTLTKEEITEDFKFLFDKNDDFRVDTAAGTIALTLAIFNWTYEEVPGERGVEIRASLAAFADGVSDYLINDLKKEDRERAEKELAEKSKGLLEYHLSYDN